MLEYLGPEYIDTSTCNIDIRRTTDSDEKHGHLHLISPSASEIRGVYHPVVFMYTPLVPILEALLRLAKLMAHCD